MINKENSISFLNHSKDLYYINKKLNIEGIKEQGFSNIYKIYKKDNEKELSIFFKNENTNNITEGIIDFFKNNLDGSFIFIDQRNFSEKESLSLMEFIQNNYQNKKIRILVLISSDSYLYVKGIKEYFPKPFLKHRDLEIKNKEKIKKKDFIFSNINKKKCVIYSPLYILELFIFGYLFFKGLSIFSYPAYLPLTILFIVSSLFSTISFLYLCQIIEKKNRKSIFSAVMLLGVLLFSFSLLISFVLYFFKLII